MLLSGKPWPQIQFKPTNYQDALQVGFVIPVRDKCCFVSISVYYGASCQTLCQNMYVLSCLASWRTYSIILIFILFQPVWPPCLNKHISCSFLKAKICNYISTNDCRSCSPSKAPLSCFKNEKIIRSNPQSTAGFCFKKSESKGQWFKEKNLKKEGKVFGLFFIIVFVAVYCIDKLQMFFLLDTILQENLRL